MLFCGRRVCQFAGSSFPLSAMASMSAASARVTTSASSLSITARACLPEPPWEARMVNVSPVCCFHCAANAPVDVGVELARRIVGNVQQFMVGGGRRWRRGERQARDEGAVVHVVSSCSEGKLRAGEEGLRPRAPRRRALRRNVSGSSSRPALKLLVRYQFRPNVQPLSAETAFEGSANSGNASSSMVRAAVAADQFERTPARPLQRERMVRPDHALVAGVLAGQHHAAEQLPRAVESVSSTARAGAATSCFDTMYSPSSPKRPP